MSKHTPGPWKIGRHAATLVEADGDRSICSTGGYQRMSDGEKVRDENIANARLITAAPDMVAEMIRYLPIIEAAEREPALWERLTAGTGIATANGYRAAIAKAEGK